MSNVVSFLASMGRSADLRHAATPALYKALSAHQVDQDAQWAILRGDAAHLKTLLGARSSLVCLVALPDADVAEGVDDDRLAANAR